MSQTITVLNADELIHQCNLIQIATQYGYTENRDIKFLAESLLNHILDEKDPLHEALLRVSHVRKVFLRKLENTLQPLIHGINRQWRKTQSEGLSSIIMSLERGYSRLLSEIPTGAGKSMLIGALVRAGLDTMKELNLECEIHIFTSRIAIAGQLIEEVLPKEEQADLPLEMGRKGDVRLWCPELTDENIRLLAGQNGSSQKELSKNSLITVSTYQGLRIGRVTQHFKKPVLLSICDESHRVTERVVMLLEKLKSFAFGFSATVLGPNRDPFVFFERIKRPEILSDKKTTYIDYLCYHKSISEMIKDGELKPVRWINARNMRIDVSKASTKNPGIHEIFVQETVAKILMKNPELGVEVISEAYLGDHPGLILSGSKPIWQRRGICYVDRIETAKACVELCNKILPQKIKEKYGETAYFKAGSVDGKMSSGEYEKVTNEFRKGEITLLFSVDKIGEGVDFPFVDLIIPLRVFGIGSMWELIQRLGRGLRINPLSPFDDLLVLDLVFQSDRHLLASVLGIFGRSALISGGLLAGWGNSYELEKKVFELLRQCKTWTELWSKLSHEEQILFPFIQQKMLEEKMRLTASGTNKIQNTAGTFANITAIEFVEHDEIKLALSLGNQEEASKYAISVLKTEGYSSVERLLSLHDASLGAFGRRRFGNFRDGLTMISLVLGENKKVITESVWKEFVLTLKKYGLPQGTVLLRRDSPQRKLVKPLIHQKTKVVTNTPIQRKSINSEFHLEKLENMVRNLFGVDLIINAKYIDLHKEPYWTAQCLIVLPDGQKIESPPCRSVDEKVAKHGSAQELYKILTSYIEKKQITLYRGTELYTTYRKVLRAMLCAKGLGNIVYTSTERNGVFVVQATCEKSTKMVSPVRVNTSEVAAKQHADVALAVIMLHQNPEFLFMTKEVDKKRLENIKQLIKQLQLSLQETLEEVNFDGYKVYKTKIKCAIYEKVFFGITPDHARLGALEKIYENVSVLN